MLEKRIEQLERRVEKLELELLTLKTNNSTQNFNNNSLLNKEDHILFKEHFDKLDKKIYPVKICELRKSLKWEENRFNNVIEKLLSENQIKLIKDNIATLNIRDLGDSYIDNDGNTYVSLSWINWYLYFNYYISW